MLCQSINEYGKERILIFVTPPQSIHPGFTGSICKSFWCKFLETTGCVNDSSIRSSPRVSSGDFRTGDRQITNIKYAYIGNKSILCTVHQFDLVTNQSFTLYELWSTYHWIILISDNFAWGVWPFAQPPSTVQKQASWILASNIFVH